jgi:integrase
MVRKRNRVSPEVPGRRGPRKQGSKAGLRQVPGGYSIPMSAGSARDAAGNLGKRRQFRLTIRIDESFGTPEACRALARARLADIVAMRDALVAVDRGGQAEYLMRKAGAVANDPEKFHFAIAAADVVMVRPSAKSSEATTKFSTWGLLARAWCKQDLAVLYPNAGYGKLSGESTDEPRVEFLCKYIADVPLATFNDDDYWRAMRPARAHCKTDSTFKAYAQVCRRVLKIACELRIIPAWPLSAVCKLPIVPKSSNPVFPFLYPDEYVRLMRCEKIGIEWRVLWGFIVREGLRISEAFRIQWRHLSQLDNGRWLLDVPDSKTGRALNFVLNVGTGEVLEAFRKLRPDLAGPFTWMKATNLKKAAERVRDHIEQSGTTRERLLTNDGRLRRLREHDLRSTFVTWCKLAGVDNETISQHTGHESSTMIARYNRSKATIEHLGLARYLPLDQAMGLDVRGELAAGAPAPLLLGAGEHTAYDPELPVGAHPVKRAGVTFPTEAGAQPSTAAATEAEVGNHHRPGQGRASSTPGADLPGARLPVTSPLHEPAGPGNTATTAADFDSGYAPGAELRARFAAPEGEAPRRVAARGARAPRRGVAGRRGVSHGSPANLGAKSATAAEVDSAGEGGAHLVHPGEAAPRWSSRDTSRDTAVSGEVSPVPGNAETSMFSAVVRETGVEPARLAALEPKSEPGRPQATKPEGTAPATAPEGTGSGEVSRAAVTPLLAQLQAAHRQASEEFNWTAARGLEPLIEAERVRLSNEAAAARAAAPPEPVRLEVVRAQRGERGGR